MTIQKTSSCRPYRRLQIAWFSAALLGGIALVMDASGVQADTPPKVAPSSRAMDLYGPKLQASDIPVWVAPVEPSGGCQTVGLYEPSLPGDVSRGSACPRKISATAGGMDLYAPSMPASILPSLPSGKATPTSYCENIYAPSLQTLRNSADEGCEFGGLVNTAYWDEGIGPVGMRNRRFGMVRRSMYAADNDVLSILYDLELNSAEEPPRELSKVLLPTYRIEPPDLLLIEAIKLVPRAPYRISPFDVLEISAGGTIPDQPIRGYFLVEAEGIVSLGPSYLPMRVVGMTVDEASAEIMRKLKQTLEKPSVSVKLSRLAGVQQISNLYPVGLNGTVNLRGYGEVHVSGKTMAEARVAIEKHLEEYFDSPDITVDVMGYNSKVYYIIIAGAENGESIFRFPVTGNETVLDAISNINGLPQVSSRTMWVARPGPSGLTRQDILPVNFTAISRGGVTDTNYQLMPGDRLYIVDDKLIATNKVISVFTDPIERMLRVSQLGSSAISGMQIMGRAYNQNRR
jgi:polysaccharide export outer membrane protein